MEITQTELPGVVLIKPRVFEDSRGFFFESYNEEKFRDAGITCRFVQDNHSKSVKGTLRGLHYQVVKPQAKLCRVVKGDVLDVVVDVRAGSPHFGKHISTVLSAEDHSQIFIPRGYAHGFIVLSETAEFLYKCDEFYFPQHERGIIWNDASLEIDWGCEDPIVSEKDSRHPRLVDRLVVDLPDFV